MHESYRKKESIYFCRKKDRFVCGVDSVAAALISVGGMLLIRKTISRPLSMITAEMKKFAPSQSRDYTESGVMNLNIQSHDEMEDIHNEIRSMQIRILEYLKYINDKFGHTAGDDYLRGCCRIVCQIYKHSPVYRIGGDEFVAILIGEDYEKRKERMQELRTAFETSYNRNERDPWHRYSAAFGMAEHAFDDITFDLVFKRADKAMYEEKKRFKEEHGIPISER